MMHHSSLCPYVEVNYRMNVLPLKFSTQGCTTQAVNASDYANTRPHVCVRLCA